MKYLGQYVYEKEIPRIKNRLTCTRGVVAKVLDCDILVHEFEVQ